jgi:hypothetical protein
MNQINTHEQKSNEPRIETKEQLVNIIREWVKIDNDVQKLQIELNTKKLEKKKTSLNLINLMKENEIDCFQINDGKIQYKKQNIKKPLSKKVLMNLLNQYYGDDPEKANELNQFLIENREESTKENIILKR